MKGETGDRLAGRTLATLKIVCPHCGHSFEMPTVYHKKQEGLASNICPKQECGKLIPKAYIDNRVRLFLKQMQVMYYKGAYKCSDNVCSNVTR